jgi:hypothetical protein
MTYRQTARVLSALLALGFSAPAIAQDAPVKSELPVLVTSSGQALDAFTLKTLLTRAGVENTYEPLAKTERLAGMRTLVIVMGASVKGFGAAGVTADTEIARTRELLKTAKEQKIPTIGVHIGGAARRDNLSMQFVEVVAPAADYLVVWKDGNEDGYFTRVAGEKKVPLTTLNLPIEAGKTLAKSFGK